MLANQPARRRRQLGERQGDLVDNAFRPQPEASKFVDLLFSELRRCGVRWLVLRNYQKLPGDIGQDLDLLVAPTDLPRAAACLRRAALLCQMRIHGFAASPHFMYFLHWKDNPGRVIHVDLFWSMGWRGIPLFDPLEILAAARRHEKGFLVPSDAHEALVNCITGLLYNGTLKRKYRESIQMVFRRQHDFTKQHIHRLFGRRYGAWLIDAVEGGRWHRLRRRAMLMRVVVVVYAARYRPFQTVKEFGGEVVRRWRRFLQPPGVAIHVHGQVIEGLTTILEEVEQFLTATYGRGLGIRLIGPDGVPVEANRAGAYHGGFFNRAVGLIRVVWQTTVGARLRAAQHGYTVVATDEKARECRTAHLILLVLRWAMRARVASQFELDLSRGPEWCQLTPSSPDSERRTAHQASVHAGAFRSLADWLCARTDEMESRTLQHWVKGRQVVYSKHRRE